MTPFVDLHSDLLLDVVHRRAIGEREVLRRRHVPALAAAGVRVQVLAVWTDPDLPQEGALRAALRAIEAAHREAEESPDAFRLVTSTRELDDALRDGALAGVLALEGAEPLGDDPALIDLLWRLGVRMVGLTWNHPNAFADGCGDPRNGGLTRLGRELADRMAARGIALDLSHLSDRGCQDALALDGDGPTIFASHVNARAVHGGSRNLPDDVLAELGARGSVVGLTFLPVFVGPGDLAERLADHHAHVRRVAGPAAPACGADFVAFLPGRDPDATLHGLPPDVDPALAHATEPSRERTYADFAAALRGRGTPEAEVDAVMRDNALAFLRRLLG